MTVHRVMIISVNKTATTNSAMDSAAVVVIIINVIIKDKVNVNRDDRLVNSKKMISFSFNGCLRS